MMNLMECVQNEDLTVVAVKIADCITSNAEIQSYCYSKFGKVATVYVGPQESSLLAEDDTPFICVGDMSKNEGLKDTAEYAAIISVGIIVEDVATAETEAGSKVFEGHQRVSELLTLVQDALNRYHCHPPTTVEQYLPGLVGASPCFWQGYMAVTWQIDLPIGQKIEF